MIPVRAAFNRLQGLLSGRRTGVGRVRFGSLRRVTPISRQFGYDRGRPVDRYYIEQFLAKHANAISGNVLEIGDSTYTIRYGENRVTSSDVLHVNDDNPRATIVADLSNAPQIESDQFDCIIITQTLHLIFDLDATVRTLFRILRPGGTLLLTVPGITHVSADRWGTSWFWAFTDQSIRRLFAGVFPESNLQITTFGNILTTTAFLYGLAMEDLRTSELHAHDPHYQLIISLRADRPRDA